jgi:hypothetical protein
MPTNGIKMVMHSIHLRFFSKKKVSSRSFAVLIILKLMENRRSYMIFTKIIEEDLTVWIRWLPGTIIDLTDH